MSKGTGSVELVGGDRWPADNRLEGKVTLDGKDITGHRVAERSADVVSPTCPRTGTTEDLVLDMTLWENSVLG